MFKSLVIITSCLHCKDAKNLVILVRNAPVVLNTTLAVSGCLQNNLKRHGGQSLDPLFYSPTSSTLLTI